MECIKHFLKHFSSDQYWHNVFLAQHDKGFDGYLALEMYWKRMHHLDLFLPTWTGYFPQILRSEMCWAPQLSDPTSPHLFTTFYTLVLNIRHLGWTGIPGGSSLVSLPSSEREPLGSCWRLKLKFSHQQQPGLQADQRELLKSSAQLTTSKSVGSEGVTSFLQHQDWKLRAYSMRILYKSFNLYPPSNRDNFTMRKFLPF